MAIVTIKFTELMKQCGISEDGRYYYYAIRATKTDRSFNPYTKYFNISKVSKKEN